MYKPTDEEIAALKAKHGELHLIKFEDKAAILKTPSRKIISYASAAATKDPMAFNETILKSCFVAGDKEVLEDDKYFMGASAQVANLIEIKTATLEKL